MFSDGKIREKVTYEQMGKRASRISAALAREGVMKGDRVLLLSENRPEWPIAYFGIALAGAVSVPLLTGFTAAQIRHIAFHAGAKAVCVSRAMAEKFETVKDRESSLESSLKESFSRIPFIYIDEITEDTNSVEEFSVTQGPDDLATIIYTSGTQGTSKGVMLSSGNIISSALSSLSFFKIFSSDRFLSVLPIAHSYECGIGMIFPVIRGSSVTYIDKPPAPSVLLPALKAVRPTAMLSVPLLIEKMYSNSIAPKLKNNKLYRFPLTRRLAVKAAGRELVSAMGGKIRVFGIGGAPLSAEVEDFLYKAGFPYTIGYGLTETAPLIAGNTPLRHAFNSGIEVAKGVSLRIEKREANPEDGEGEIQARGPNVMMGYYNDAEKTAQAFTPDGWLRTGDLGSLDKKGRLRVRGRLKSLILGPSGENIYPEEIESVLGSSGLVEESLVYSGKKGELVALVTLSETAKTAAGVIEHTLEDLRAWVNKKLTAFSRLNRIEIRSEPFEKTPTMKIKRYLYI